MAKKQDHGFRMVSPMVAEIEFGIEGKGYPTMEGFKARITYADAAQILRVAAGATKIAIRAKMKATFDANGTYGMVPGKLYNVDGLGNRTISAEEKAELAREQALKTLASTPDLFKNATWEQKAAICQAMGLPIPPRPIESPVIDVVAEKGLTVDLDAATLAETPSGNGTRAYRYDADQLRGLGPMRLRVLAQKEQLEGYGELTEEQLIEELSLIEA